MNLIVGVAQRLAIRLPGVLGVMLGASLLVSATLRLVPGDPITLILGEQATEADRSRLEDRLCLLYTSPSPRDRTRSRMPSSA